MLMSAQVFIITNKSAFANILVILVSFIKYEIAVFASSVAENY